MSPPQTALGQIAPLDHTRWFTEEVQPHEAALRAYLRGRFPKLEDVDDLVQETYVRLLRAQKPGKLLEVRPYLFATAKNVAFDILRRNQILTIDRRGDIEDLPLAEERPDAAEAMAQEQEVALLREAVAALPPRCREILRLRRFEGLSHQAIADRLGISPSTVDTQLCLAVYRCRRFLLERGVSRARLEHVRQAMKSDSTR